MTKKHDPGTNKQTDKNKQGTGTTNQTNKQASKQSTTAAAAATTTTTTTRTGAAAATITRQHKPRQFCRQAHGCKGLCGPHCGCG